MHTSSPQTLSQDNGDKHEAVETYLGKFSGDKEAAIQAIWQYQRQSFDLTPQDQHALAPIIIAATDLTKTYKLKGREVPVLKGVNFQIRKNEITALTGPSGSGKSTLLHILGCLDKASSGKLWIDGQNIEKLDASEMNQLRGHKIGFVFQSFYLQPNLSVLDNILVPAMFNKTPISEAKERANGLLDKFGLSKIKNHYPSAISGGESQRVALCRALINQPTIIVADEPTGNLDKDNSRQVMNGFKEIQALNNTTIVIATHDLEIASHCDRQLRLRDGTLR